MKQQCAYIIETPTVNGIKSSLEETPLAMVRASTESGNVIITYDCNTYGITDHRPDLRNTPIGKDRVDTLMKAVIAARHGVQDPASFHHGEVFVMVDGGKDRKRVLLNPLKNNKQKGGRDRNRVICRRIMFHASETSWRARRRRAHGTARLSQNVYLVASSSTFNAIGYQKFPTIPGSTQCDVAGPIDLDRIEDMVKFPKEITPKAYFGKRLVLAGGRVKENSSEDDDDNDEDEAGEGQNADHDTGAQAEAGQAIAPHSLPVSVQVNLMSALNAKHVIDLTPGPNNLAYEVVKRGGSYTCVCATDVMREFLKKQLEESLMKGIADPKETLLYDPRFKRDTGTVSL